MQHKHKAVVSNISALGIIQAANYVFPLVTLPFLSRILGPQGLGMINYLSALVVYFHMFITFGFHATAAREFARNRNEAQALSRIFSEVLLCQLVLFVLAGIIFSVLLFTNPVLRSNISMSMFGFAFCISTVLTQNWIFQVTHRLTIVAFLNIGGKLLYMLLLFVAINNADDYFLQPLLLSITQILVAGSSFILAIKRYSLHFVAVPFRKVFKLIWQGKELFLALMISTFVITLQIFLLGIFASREQVGYFTAAQRLINVSQLVIVLPLNQVCFPYLTRYFASNREKGWRTVRLLIPAISIASVVIGVVLFAGRHYLVDLIFGDMFAPAAALLALLCPMPLLMALNVLLGVNVMYNVGLERRYFACVLSAFAISVSVAQPLLSNYGAMGCAMSWLAYEASLTCLLLIVLYRRGIRLFSSFHMRRSHIVKAYRFAQNMLS